MVWQREEISIMECEHELSWSEIASSTSSNAVSWKLVGEALNLRATPHVTNLCRGGLGVARDRCGGCGGCGGVLLSQKVQWLWAVSKGYHDEYMKLCVKHMDTHGDLDIAMQGLPYAMRLSGGNRVGSIVLLASCYVDVVKTQQCEQLLYRMDSTQICPTSYTWRAAAFLVSWVLIAVWIREPES